MDLGFASPVVVGLTLGATGVSYRTLGPFPEGLFLSGISVVGVSGTGVGAGEYLGLGVSLVPGSISDDAGFTAGVELFSGFGSGVAPLRVSANNVHVDVFFPVSRALPSNGRYVGFRFDWTYIGSDTHWLVCLHFSEILFGREWGFPSVAFEPVDGGFVGLPRRFVDGRPAGGRGPSDGFVFPGPSPRVFACPGVGEVLGWCLEGGGVHGSGV